MGWEQSLSTVLKMCQGHSVILSAAASTQGGHESPQK